MGFLRAEVSLLIEFIAKTGKSLAVSSWLLCHINQYLSSVPKVISKNFILEGGVIGLRRMNNEEITYKLLGLGYST